MPLPSKVDIEHRYVSMVMKLVHQPIEHEREVWILGPSKGEKGEVRGIRVHEVIILCVIIKGHLAVPLLIKALGHISKVKHHRFFLKKEVFLIYYFESNLAAIACIEIKSNNYFLDEIILKLAQL